MARLLVELGAACDKYQRQAVVGLRSSDNFARVHQTLHVTPAVEAGHARSRLDGGRNRRPARLDTYSYHARLHPLGLVRCLARDRRRPFQPVALVAAKAAAQRPAE